MEIVGKYLYIKGIDSPGYDIVCVGRKSIEELMKIAEDIPNCVCFNNLGYMKNTICTKLKPTMYIYGNNGGIFIKLDAINSAFPFFDTHTSVSGYTFKPRLTLASKPKYNLVDMLLGAPDIVGFTTSGATVDSSSELVHDPHLSYSEGTYIKNTHKKSIKVKLICDWTSSEIMLEEWCHMLKKKYFWNNLEFVPRGTADFYVIVNRPNPYEEYEPSRTIVVQLEPWCGDPSQKWGVKTWGIWARPDRNVFLDVITQENNVNCAFWQLGITYKELKSIKFEKYKMISTICSSKYFDPGHIKRIDFLKYIESIDDPLVKIDIYNHDNKHNFKNYVGPHPPGKKEAGIINYKYYFMAENNNENNFITEKLWEPILTETLCFYYGCPNVTEYVDPRAFIWVNLDNFEEAFNTIKNAIINNEWEKRIEYIRREKYKILEHYSFFPTIERSIMKHITKLQDSNLFFTKHIQNHIIDKPKTVSFIYSHNIESNLDLRYLLNKYMMSGLLDTLDYLFILNTGNPVDISVNTKVKIIQLPYNQREAFVLNILWMFANNYPETKILYTHTRDNVDDVKNNNLTDLIELMSFYLIDKFMDANIALSVYDTVGCNYISNKYYSGNFWWTTGKYICSIKAPDSKYSAHVIEYWLCSSRNIKPLCVHSSGINHNTTPYPSSMYKDIPYNFPNVFKNNKVRVRGKCINLERRLDRKEEMLTIFNSLGIEDYVDFFKAVDGKLLNPIIDENILKMFIGNDFGSRSSFIGCALSHYRLWQMLCVDPDYDAYYIFEDDVKFIENYTMRVGMIFDNFTKSNMEWDILYTGHSVRYSSLDEYNKTIEEYQDNSVIPHIRKFTVGGFFGYILHKNAASKILKYIESNGIKHGIDYLVFTNADQIGLKLYETVPRLVLTPYVAPGVLVDSDIQYDYGVVNIINV